MPIPGVTPELPLRAKVRVGEKNLPERIGGLERAVAKARQAVVGGGAAESAFERREVDGAFETAGD